jgi:hypothetical protein
MAPYPLTTLNASLGVSLAKADISDMDPVGDGLPEGRGGVLLFDGGIASIAIMQAFRDTIPLVFNAIKDTARIRDQNDLKAGLRTNRFRSEGTLNLRLRFGASGTIPGNLRFRVVLRDAQTGEELTLLRSIFPSRDTVFSISTPLSFGERQLTLGIEPVGIDKPVRLELERWFVLPDESESTPIPNPSATAANTNISAYKLHENYPNPFNPSTQFNFELPVDGNVFLAIYDVLGQQVAELVNANKESGYHTITWNAESQASGVYMARFIVTGEEGKVVYSKLNKLLLMK